MHLYMLIIIITLFKEDNIFGRYASLTYGPQKGQETAIRKTCP